MQNEWKIRKDFELLFPNYTKGIELLCQTSLFIGTTRYRDVVLQLSKTQFKLVTTFLSEVSKNQVRVNDVNWRKRFEALYQTDKPVKPKSTKPNIQHLIKHKKVEDSPDFEDEEIVFAEEEEEVVEDDDDESSDMSL